jgi:carbon monoxide dehydrogenase subunit G
MITINRDIDVRVPPATVWATLWDVAAVARCLPGCGEIVELEPRRHYRATIRDRVGPFTVTVPLEVTVHDVVDGQRLSLQASGRDATLGSPVRMSLAVSVAPADGGARLTLDGAGEIGGKLAALGQAVTRRKARETLDRFAANLRILLGGDLGAAAV